MTMYYVMCGTWVVSFRNMLKVRVSSIVVHEQGAVMS